MRILSLSKQISKLPHFYSRITFNTLIHLSLHRSRSFPPAPTLTAKVSYILDTAKLLAMFFIPKDKKGIERCHCREKNTSTFLFHGYNSMPYTYNTIPYEKVNNLLRLFFSYRSFSGIHRKITKRCLDFINAIL